MTEIIIERLGKKVKVCPICENILPENERICRYCGYDFRSLY